MKTQEFLNTLKSNQDKSLIFEYMPNAFVGANYHITEVKHVNIESVDCGSKKNAWSETIIQLWENPLEAGKRDYLSVLNAETQARITLQTHIIQLKQAKINYLTSLGNI